jgi:DNA-directed RNA polymerase II subunit RPB2
MDTRDLETQSIIAHGMPLFIKEKNAESDIFTMHICDDCGKFAFKVIDKNIYECKPCQNTTKITEKVVSYKYKLLYQELTQINILPKN